MRFIGVIVAAICLSGLVCQPAHAEKRVALVIGNSNYQNVSHLANPANDAAMLAATFRSVKFDVVELRTDVTATETRRVLREFADKARHSDIAVIYYAGHGIEVDGTNYVIPVDAILERDADVYDEALPLDRLLVAVDPAKQLRLIILDACRDNPFAKTMKRTIAMRAIGQGLARVEPTSPNTMIAFAARAGSTAADGDGKNSPFAVALANHLTTPGLDLRKAFGFVRDDVLKATNNRQEPFTYGSLGGDDLALVPAPSAAPAAPAPDPNAAIRRDYELAAQVGTREAWDSFIATYPDGFYAKLAIAQRNKLLAEEARVAAAEKARLAAEEQARLAAERVKAGEQAAKAEADARAAEQARVTAEKKKAIEDVKAAEAERMKAVAKVKADEDAKQAAAKARADVEATAQAEKAAAEARLAAEAKRLADEAKAAEAERAKAAALAKAAEEEAKLAATRARLQAAEEEAKLAEAKAHAEALQRAKAAEDARLNAEAARAKASSESAKPIGPVAALTPPGQSEPAPVAGDVKKMLQSELRRVGCNTGAADGDWNAAAQRSLSLFNKHAGTTLDVKAASLDALDVVKSKTGRICPLICEHGFKADGDSCVKIVCKPGYQVGDDNGCEKTESKKPVAKREAPAAEPRPAQAAPPPKQASGQTLCNQQGCRAVRPGCFIGGGGRGGNQRNSQREVCP